MRRTGNWLSVILCSSCIFCCLLACAAYGFTWLADPQYVSGKPPIVLCILVDGVPQQPSEVLSEENLTFQLRYYENGVFGNVVTDTDKFDDPLPHTDKLRVRWNFGDGETVVEEKVEATTTHAFKKTGMLTVSWSVLDLAQDQYANYQANANDGPNGSQPCSTVEAKLCTVHWDAEGSFALSVGPSVSLSIDPSGIPRDNTTEAIATATVTYKGSPVAGKTVSFSIQSGPGVIIDPVTATTNAEGKATAKVKSSDIAASDANVKVRATVLQGNYAEVDLTVGGLTMTLESEYDKIYSGQLYRGTTELTCKVFMDSPRLDAKGKVTFTTQAGGFVDQQDGGNLKPSLQVDLTAGEAKVLLSAGNYGCDNVVTATMSPLYVQENVKIAAHDYIQENHSPNKRTIESAVCEVKVLDQWGEYWPGACIRVTWRIPNAQGGLTETQMQATTSITSTDFTPISSGAAQSRGQGWCQAVSINSATGATILAASPWLPHWEVPHDFAALYSANAAPISTQWNEQSQKHSVVIDAIALLMWLLKL